MEDVAYYDSQLHYQKRVGEIEKERLRLEREMFSMMKSDKKLQNLRAAKLRSYWQQICEREKKAKERNEDLLRDFEELEVRLLTMEAKTSKLRKMKVEYDEKVKQMYPKWRQEVEITRAKKQLQERGITLNQQKEAKSSPRHNQHSKPADLEMSSPNRIALQESSIPQKPRSQTKTPDVVRPFSAGSPTKTLLTSTPKSKSKDLSSDTIVSVQPPVSFADPKQTTMGSPRVNTTSAINLPQRSTNIVHTIPTAFSPEGANSDFSDASSLSDKVEKPSTSLSSHNVHARIPSSALNHVKNDIHPGSRKAASTPTASLAHSGPSHGLPTDSRSEPNNPGVGLSSSTMSITSPIHVQKTASPVTAISEEREQLQSPAMRPDSKLSISSFGSDDLSVASNINPVRNTSPRQNQPLTANAAYQALLKQHSGANAKSLEIPDMNEDSDEDDLENLLSPRVPDQKEKKEVNSESDEDDAFSDSKRGASPVYIPTAMSSGPNMQVKQLQQESRNVPKAPWETDSEDEFGNENTNLSNTGGSSMWDSKLKKYDPQDDFDFYD